MNEVTKLIDMMELIMQHADFDYDHEVDALSNQIDIARKYIQSFEEK